MCRIHNQMAPKWTQGSHLTWPMIYTQKKISYFSKKNCYFSACRQLFNSMGGGGGGASNKEMGRRWTAKFFLVSPTPPPFHPNNWPRNIAMLPSHVTFARPQICYARPLSATPFMLIYGRTLGRIELDPKNILYNFERAIDWCIYSSNWRKITRVVLILKLQFKLK